MTELTDEMITELAGWLFTIEDLPAGHIRYKFEDNDEWGLGTMPKMIEFMRTPDGLEAVENAMIARGYVVSVQSYSNERYVCSLRSERANIYASEQAETKAEAVLLSAYKAMKKEVGDVSNHP